MYFEGATHLCIATENSSKCITTFSHFDFMLSLNTKKQEDMNMEVWVRMKC